MPSMSTLRYGITPETDFDTETHSKNQNNNLNKNTPKIDFDLSYRRL